MRLLRLLRRALPDLDRQALAAVASGVHTEAETTLARRYGRLLQTYEAMFWNTLADE